MTDRVDNVILLQRYYNDDPLEADCYVAISKARHWDMAECEIDLWMDRASMNLLMQDQVAKSNLPSYKGREESNLTSYRGREESSKTEAPF